MTKNKQSNEMSSAAAALTYHNYVLTDNIIKAHIRSRKSLLIWGSSGFGKSAKVAFFTRTKELIGKEGVECFILPMADKSAIDMFMLAIVNDKAEEYPTWWIRKLCSPSDENGKPYPDMVLFLDEITRANPSMLPIIMEIANDRRIAGRPMRDNISVIAASNFDDEDGGHQDLTLNQAGMRRFTHVTNVLDYATAHKHTTNPYKRAVMDLLKAGSYMQGFKQGNFFDKFDHADLDCERQRTDAFDIAVDNMDILTDTEIKTIFCGRVGLSAGERLTDALIAVREKKKKKALPDQVNYENFAEIHELETTTQRMEVASLLVTQITTSYKLWESQGKGDESLLKDFDMAFDYMNELAQPETVQIVVSRLGNRFLINVPVCLRKGNIQRSANINAYFVFSATKGNSKYVGRTAST
jgi:hypothetical protein